MSAQGTLIIICTPIQLLHVHSDQHLTYHCMFACQHQDSTQGSIHKSKNLHYWHISADRCCWMERDTRWNLETGPWLEDRYLLRFKHTITWTSIIIVQYIALITAANIAAVNIVAVLITNMSPHGTLIVIWKYKTFIPLLYNIMYRGTSTSSK